MKSNTSKWAVEIGNEKISEAVQRIAFSYGYNWTGVDNRVQYTDRPFLVFDPDDKIITYSCNREHLKEKGYEIVLYIDKMVELFNNPPTADLKVGDFTIRKNGDIMLYNGVIVAGDKFDKVVNERAKFLKREDPVALKRKLPVVQFVYTSQNSGRKVRNVLVINKDDEKIVGLDEDDNMSLKTFLFTRMTGVIEFRGFVEA